MGDLWNDLDLEIKRKKRIFRQQNNQAYEIETDQIDGEVAATVEGTENEE